MVKKAFIFIGLLCLLFAYNSASASSIAGPYTTRVYNEDQNFSNNGFSFSSISKTSDGGYILGGRTVITKLSSNLSTQWSKSYLVNNGYEIIDVKEYLNGDYVGLFQRIGDGPLSAPSTVLRLTSTGDIVWSYTLKPTEKQSATALNVKANGNIVVSGRGTYPSSSITVSFAAEISPAGMFLNRSIIENTGKRLSLNSLNTFSDNSAVALMTTNTTGSHSYLYGKSVISKFGTSFSTINNSATIDFSPSLSVHYEDIIQASDGDYVVVGRVSTNRPIVYKISSDLSTMRWAYTYSNDTQEAGTGESGERVVEVPNGFLITGTTTAYNPDYQSSRPYAMFLSNQGEINWVQLTHVQGSSYDTVDLALNANKFALISNYYYPSSEENSNFLYGGWLTEHPINGNCTNCNDTETVAFTKTAVTPSITPVTIFSNYSITEDVVANVSSIDGNFTVHNTILSGEYQVNTTNNVTVTVADSNAENTQIPTVRLAAGLPFAEVDVTLSGNLNWSTVQGAADSTIGKAFVAGLGNVSGVAPTHSLLIPKVSGATGAYICPQALTMAEVSESCPAKVQLNAGSQNISTVVIGNTEYWKVDGLTGTGGGNIIAAVNTPAAAASSSVTSVLLAATGLDIMQAIGVSLFAMGITVFIYVTRRTSRL